MAEKKFGGSVSPGSEIGEGKWDKGFFLGPLYAEPGPGTLGPEPVGGPTKGPAVKDPLGYAAFPKAGVGYKKAKGPSSSKQDSGSKDKY